MSTKLDASSSVADREIKIYISQLKKMIIPIKTFLYLCPIQTFFVIYINSSSGSIHCYIYTTNHMSYRLWVMDVNNVPFVKQSGH